METCNAYEHKKFNNSQKRKRSQDDREESESLVVQSEVVVAQQTNKRLKTGQFFRPWLDQATPTTTRVASPSSSPPVQKEVGKLYHANMVRIQAPRKRSPKEQLRRDRNTIASWRNRRAKQEQEALLQSQYDQYKAQHSAILEQQVRLSLYYVRCLQQVAAASDVVLNSNPQRMLTTATATATTPVATTNAIPTPRH